MSELRVNNITNRDGKRGTVVAGIPQVSSTSHFVVPTGRTGQRYADGGENIVRDGLVLYLDAKYSYPGTNGIGMTTTNPDVKTWYDMSGNGNDFEIRGVIGTSTVIYDASFGGIFEHKTGQTTGSIVCAPFNHPVNQMTVEMWVKVPSSQSNQALLSYAVTGDDNNQLIFNPTNLEIYITSAADGAAATGISIADGSWKQFVRTSIRSSGEEKVYINGVERFSRILKPGTNFTPGGSLVLGQEQDSVAGGFDGTQALQGSISSLKMYNRALTAAEVLQNYNALKGRFGLS